MNNNNAVWQQFDYGQSMETLITLHMKMQIAGKVKLALTPFLNQWWNTAFFLNSSGMTSGLISYNNIFFEILFDFIEHRVSIRTSTGKTENLSIASGSVAEFYNKFMKALHSIGINALIDPIPAEVADPISCEEDQRSEYHPEVIINWWNILLKTSSVLEKFRTPFGGKSSPVNFFWGSFDLNHTRFSGKSAEPPSYGGAIMKYAENEENYSCGFWHGNAKYPKPAFYAYMYPAPKNTEELEIKPQQARYDRQLGEFILDYNELVDLEDPETVLLDFFNSTFETLGKASVWNLEQFRAKVPKAKK
jgi:hypothetical protein